MCNITEGNPGAVTGYSPPAGKKTGESMEKPEEKGKEIPPGLAFVLELGIGLCYNDDIQDIWRCSL